MEDEHALERILSAHPSKFERILKNASEYRFQVLLSRVERGPGGARRLVRHGYRVDSEYFYPASAIKLAAVVAAVEKLERLHFSEGTDVHSASPLCFFPLLEGGKETRCDPTNLNQQHITLAHEIRKLFLVSDNEAFNRLYAMVGHRTLNQIMWEKGLKSTRIRHRLSVNLSPNANRICEPVEVQLHAIPYVMAPKKSELQIPDNKSMPGILVGKAFVDEKGDVIGEPMDFSLKNYMSLVDLQDLLVKVVRPDVEMIFGCGMLKLGTAALQVGEDVRMMLLEAMSQYPASSSNPVYDGADYPDDYCKFFLPGVARVRSKGAIRIYNKIGRAFGFTVDNAYILDIETGKSFFLSAVIYTNWNGILNDDKYEYEAVADKVMADLGEAIADAVWNVPSSLINKSLPFDQTPSSLWNVLSNPIYPEQSCLRDPEKLAQVAASLDLDYRDETSDDWSSAILLVSNVAVQTGGDVSRKGSTVENRIAEVTQEPWSEVWPRGTAVVETGRKQQVRACYHYFLDE